MKVAHNRFPLDPFSIVAGMFVGWASLAFNQNALAVYHEQTIIHPLIVVMASGWVGLVEFFHPKIIQDNLRSLLASFTMGIACGAVVVIAYHHWGYGFMCVLPVIVGWALRQTFFPHWNNIVADPVGTQTRDRIF